jgi:four helix bundle protein
MASVSYKWLVMGDEWLTSSQPGAAMGEEQFVKSFRDLTVWHRSIELCTAIYEFTRSFPGDELYGLRSQLRRASVSIPSNIAEGCGRRLTGELIQFAAIARGSNFEVQTQLAIANKLHYGSDHDLMECNRLSEEVGRMLNAWVNSLKKSNPSLRIANH